MILTYSPVRFFLGGGGTYPVHSLAAQWLSPSVPCIRSRATVLASICWVSLGALYLGSYSRTWFVGLPCGGQNGVVQQGDNTIKPFAEVQE